MALLLDGPYDLVFQIGHFLILIRALDVVE
jgi:hypothetical protein